MDPILGGALIGGAASLIGGFMNRDAARDASATNQASAREQMTFQKEMSDTAYQRSMKDMKLAGLNPMLAYQQGGASSPGGASASAVMPDMSDAASGLAGSAKDYINQKRERALMDSQVDLQELQGKAAKAAASQSLASARKAQTESKAIEAEMPAIESRARLDTKRNIIDEKAVLYDAVANRSAQVLGAVGSATSLGRFLRRSPQPNPSSEPGKIVPAMPKKINRDPITGGKERSQGNMGIDFQGNKIGRLKDGRLFNKTTGEIYD